MKQIIMLCDGTNNKLSGWLADTHVVLMAELLRAHQEADRWVYYDPGVGSSSQLPGVTMSDKVRRHMERLGGLAFGGGVFQNIAEGYRFLMQHWQEGDQIWLFGFSRGAFTARSIAGMVNAFGLIEAHLEPMVPSLVNTYFSYGRQEQEGIRAQVVRLFAQGQGVSERRPVLHFVGVWDTVASVGLPGLGLRMRTRPTLTGKHFRHVRQALAMDEHRAQFQPRAYAQDDGGFLLADGSQGDLVQCWFRGAHCDVGGGNDYAQSSQSLAPLAWMLSQAVQCGLRLHVPGLDLRDEAQVQTALRAMEPLAKDSKGRPLQRAAATLSSQIQANPLWALTGLAQRDMGRAAIDSTRDQPVRMQAHASVEAWSAAFPKGTDWVQPWSWGRRLGLVLAALLLLYLPLLMAQQHQGGAGWPIPSWESVKASLAVNGAFQHWQLLGWWDSHDEWRRALSRFQAPHAALAWDMAFIATWAALLAHAVAPAFARCAGLPAWGRPPSRWLKRLGWALPMAVLFDLTENLLSVLTLYAAQADVAFTGLLRPLLGLAALGKGLALAGVLWLVLWGLWRGVLARLRP